MALADIKKHFKDVLKQGRSQIGKVSGLGDNVVLDLGLGGRPFIDSLRKGTKPYSATCPVIFAIRIGPPNCEVSAFPIIIPPIYFKDEELT